MPGFFPARYPASDRRGSGPIATRATGAPAQPVGSVCRQAPGGLKSGGQRRGARRASAAAIRVSAQSLPHPHCAARPRPILDPVPSASISAPLLFKTGDHEERDCIQGRWPRTYQLAENIGLSPSRDNQNGDDRFSASHSARATKSTRRGPQGQQDRTEEQANAMTNEWSAKIAFHRHLKHHRRGAEVTGPPPSPAPCRRPSPHRVAWRLS